MRLDQSCRWIQNNLASRENARCQQYPRDSAVFLASNILDRPTSPPQPIAKVFMKKISSSLIITFATASKAFAQDLIPCPDGTMADPSIGCVTTPASVAGSSMGVPEILLKVAGAASLFIAAAATAVLIYGGIRYATAMGDEEKLGTAKKSIKWGVIGLALGIGARLLVQGVLSAAI